MATKSRARIAKRYSSLPPRAGAGFFSAPGALTNPRLSEHAVHGPRRRPDRCDPRLRGVQAPELPDQEVQAQQPGSHHPAQVLQVVPAAYRASRDPVRERLGRWPPNVRTAGARATPKNSAPRIAYATTITNATSGTPSRLTRSGRRCRT